MAEAEVLRATFMNSLAAYLVSCHVLGLGSVGADHATVTSTGNIFVKNPDYVLCFESVFALKKHKANGKRPVYPMFYMPCFKQVLGVEADGIQEEFNDLVIKAFLAVRNKCAFLVSSILFFASEFDLDMEKVNSSVELLQHNLYMNMTEQVAVKEFKRVLDTGLHVDHSISVFM
jgi:hypothetical protein